MNWYKKQSKKDSWHKVDSYFSGFESTPDIKISLKVNKIDDLVNFEEFFSEIFTPEVVILQNSYFFCVEIDEFYLGLRYW